MVVLELTDRDKEIGMGNSLGDLYRKLLFKGLQVDEKTLPFKVLSLQVGQEFNTKEPVITCYLHSRPENQMPDFYSQADLHIKKSKLEVGLSDGHLETATLAIEDSEVSVHLSTQLNSTCKSYVESLEDLRNRIDLFERSSQHLFDGRFLLKSFEAVNDNHVMSGFFTRSMSGDKEFAEVLKHYAAGPYFSS